MGAFELQDIETVGDCLDHRRLREERIIAFKVYDSCRQQNCLVPEEIGPARAAEGFTSGEEQQKEGDIIKPPQNAASATVDHLKVKRIIVVNKQPSPFKNGYWDVDVKFVFEYRITFREADASVICSVWANNTYNMKACLFGSIGSELGKEKNHNELHRKLLQQLRRRWTATTQVRASGISNHNEIHREVSNTKAGCIYIGNWRWHRTIQPHYS